MKNDQYIKLSGSLYYPAREGAFLDILNQAGLNIVVMNEPAPGWFKFTINEKESWLQDSDDDNNTEYTFFVRKGRAGRVLIASTKSNLVDKLLENLNLKNWSNNTPTVAIRDLLNDLSIKPRRTEYSIGAIYGRTNTFSPSLRTIVLYGSDVASAPIFHESINMNIQPYRLTLKKVMRNEVLTIGDKGEVVFPFVGPTSLKDVDDALKLIGDKLGHLDWGVSS